MPTPVSATTGESRALGYAARRLRGAVGMSEIIVLIQSAGKGDAGAMDRLYQLLYADLRQVAHAKLRRRPVPTWLDTTALLHESAA